MSQVPFFGPNGEFIPSYDPTMTEQWMNGFQFAPPPGQPNMLPPNLQQGLGAPPAMLNPEMAPPQPEAIPKDPANPTKGWGLGGEGEEPKGMDAKKKLDALLKKAGNLTEGQAKMIAALSTPQQLKQPGAPWAALPRGVNGAMQMQTMAPVRQQPTLAQIINGR